jgi:hypothetical protein
MFQIKKKEEESDSILIMSDMRACSKLICGMAKAYFYSKIMINILDFGRTMLCMVRVF